jgi:hypothetical protein
MYDDTFTSLGCWLVVNREIWPNGYILADFGYKCLDPFLFMFSNTLELCGFLIFWNRIGGVMVSVLASSDVMVSVLASSGVMVSVLASSAVDRGFIRGVMVSATIYQYGHITRLTTSQQPRLVNVSSYMQGYENSTYRPVKSIKKIIRGSLPVGKNKVIMNTIAIVFFIY